MAIDPVFVVNALIDPLLKPYGVINVTIDLIKDIGDLSPSLASKVIDIAQKTNFNSLMMFGGLATTLGIGGIGTFTYHKINEEEDQTVLKRISIALLVCSGLFSLITFSTYHLSYKHFERIHLPKLQQIAQSTGAKPTISSYPSPQFLYQNAASLEVDFLKNKEILTKTVAQKIIESVKKQNLTALLIYGFISFIWTAVVLALSTLVTAVAHADDDPDTDLQTKMMVGLGMIVALLATLTLPLGLTYYFYKTKVHRFNNIDCPKLLKIVNN